MAGSYIFMKHTWYLGGITFAYMWEKDFIVDFISIKGIRTIVCLIAVLYSGLTERRRFVMCVDKI